LNVYFRSFHLWLFNKRQFHSVVIFTSIDDIFLWLKRHNILFLLQRHSSTIVRTRWRWDWIKNEIRQQWDDNDVCWSRSFLMRKESICLFVLFWSFSIKKKYHSTFLIDRDYF
jgi:hypothetical protein